MGWDGVNPELELAIIVQAGDWRRRAGETKRQRSRAAILVAARALFEERGCCDTTIEAIATRAGLGSATVYIHFPTKNTIAGVVYEPIVRDLIDDALRAAGAATSTIEEIVCFVARLTRRAREHYRLTVAMVEAVQDATVRNGATLVDHDPRRIVPLTRPLIELIGAGQARGELLPYPEAADLGLLTINLLLRILTRPAETIDRTVDLVATILRRTLQPT